MTLLRRILVERRSAIVPLLAALVINVLAYFLVVYPLGVKSATAKERADSAAISLRAAEQDLAAARARVTGKARAEQDLGVFYQKVLPVDMSAARRLTFTSIPTLARQANVRYEGRQFQDETAKAGEGLGHLKIRMALEGEYENLRRFIYELETAPEFVIIDDVTLTQGEANKPLTLTLELSVYYRRGGNGA
jgi:Tfp pilus assembly protein PilO